MEGADMLAAQAYGEGVITEVIRPAAIVPESAARAILVELSLADVSHGGLWHSSTTMWSRYDRHWTGSPGASGAELVGNVQVAYGTPTKYEITLYRVTITQHGQDTGWSVASLSDEVLGYGGLTLAQCPRAVLNAPPKPFRF